MQEHTDLESGLGLRARSPFFGFIRSISSHPSRLPQERQLDLLRNLVQFNPNNRLTACKALKHAWLDELFEEADAELNVSWAWSKQRGQFSTVLQRPIVLHLIRWQPRLTHLDAGD